MFNKTSNPYKFKYIQTGIKGEGIPEVYLPPIPKDKSKILDFGGKWERIPLSDEYEEWLEWERDKNCDSRGKYTKDKRGKEIDPYHEDYIFHPKHVELADQEWDRRLNGVWIYLIEDEKTGIKKPFFLTGLHYYMLQWWDVGFKMLYFDYHREVFYWIQFWEEDPTSSGGALGTRRQVMKSVLLGAWAIERTTRTANAHLGMQGEKGAKMDSFFQLKMMQGFDNMEVDFFIPEYDKSSTQVKGISFKKQKRRNSRIEASDSKKALNSFIDIGDAGVNHYNSATMTGYVVEEPAKLEEANIEERHYAVLPALQRRDGRAFYASTGDASVEKNLKNWKSLIYDSDYSVKKDNGSTVSGLMFAFLPAQHCGGVNMKDMMDGINPYGFPYSDRNLKAILNDRKFYEDNPSQYVSQIRKYPTNLSEYFYTSADNCEFNAKILQENITRLDQNRNLVTRGDFKWVGGKRFGKIYFDHNKTGKVTIGSLPRNISLENQVRDNGEHAGKYRFVPLNDHKFCIGTDPIGYGVATGGKRSMGVIYVKSRYDSLLEGENTPELMHERKLEKYDYKTGIPVCRYAFRPDDPREYYDYVIMLCHFYGCKVHIERNAGMELIRYMEDRGYANFIMMKPSFARIAANKYSSNQNTQGTTTNRQLTIQCTALMALDVECFGHCNPFKELSESQLKFDPLDTKDHDDSMAYIFCLMAEEENVRKTDDTVYDFSALNRW